MAIYTGAVLGGPDQLDKGFCREMDDISLRVEMLQKELIEPDDGLLNVVFLFSGRVYQPPFADIRVGRYIKKDKRLAIQVPVPPDVISSENFAERFVSLLKDAIAEAKKVFDKKGVAFSLEGHLALVDKCLEGLMEAKSNG